MNELQECLICKRPAKTMACDRCESIMHKQLTDMPRYALLASHRLQPRQGGTRGTERGFGLSMAALEASCGYTATSVLENWVRDWRETYNLVPYGVATEAVPNNQLLTHICDFLTQFLHTACTNHIAINLFAGELRQQWAAMREGANETPPNSWVIPCPADTQITDHVTTCGKPIKIVDVNLETLVNCPACKTHWRVGRLLYVGAATSNSGIYVDGEAASEYLGVSERTLRQWSKKGKIKRQGSRYDITGLTHA